MTYTARIPNGIITFVETEFNCPKCTCHHEEEDYFKQMDKSKTGLIYKSCKGCKTKLGTTTDMRGDVVVWLKDEEKKTL